MAIFDFLSGSGLGQAISQAGVGYGAGTRAGEQEAYRRSQIELDRKYKQELLQAKKKELDPLKSIQAVTGPILQKYAAGMADNAMQQYFRDHPDYAQTYVHNFEIARDVHEGKRPFSQLNISFASSLADSADPNTPTPETGVTAGGQKVSLPIGGPVSGFEQAGMAPAGPPPLTTQRSPTSFLGGIFGPTNISAMDPRQQIPAMPRVFAGEPAGGLPAPPPPSAPTAAPKPAPKPKPPTTQERLLQVLQRGPDQIPKGYMTDKQWRPLQETANKAYDREVTRLQAQAKLEQDLIIKGAKARHAEEYEAGKAKLPGAQTQASLAAAGLGKERTKDIQVMRPYKQNEAVSRIQKRAADIRQGDARLTETARHNKRIEGIQAMNADTGKARTVGQLAYWDAMAKKGQFLLDNFEYIEGAKMDRAQLGAAVSLLGNRVQLGRQSTTAGAQAAPDVASAIKTVQELSNQLAKQRKRPESGTVIRRTTAAGTSPSAAAAAAVPSFRQGAAPAKQEPLSSGEVKAAQRWTREGSWDAMFAKTKDPAMRQRLKFAYRKTNKGREWTGAR